MPFCLPMLIDGLTDEVRQEAPWIVMFADDTVICSENRKQVGNRIIKKIGQSGEVEVYFGAKRNE